MPKARTDCGKPAHSAKLNVLRRRLQAARHDAEAELERLGRAKDAWRVIEEVFFDESDAARIEKRADEAGWKAFCSGSLSYPSVVVDRAWFGPGNAGAFHLWLKVHVVKGTQALGPPERVARASRKLPPITEKALASMDDEARRRLRLKRMNWTEIPEPWLQAERAAVATAALKRLNDPLVTFAVGLFFGWSYVVKQIPEIRDDYAERVALDRYREDGRNRWGEEVNRAHELVKNAALPLKRKGRRPNTVAALLFRNHKLQDAIKAARGKPYSFSRLRSLVGEVFCS